MFEKKNLSGCDHGIVRVDSVGFVKWVFLIAVTIMAACQKENDEDSPFTDPRDGHVYQTISIGSQIWMAENLNYRTESGSVYLNNDSITYSTVYGLLYDWNTAITVAPPGWHLPTDAEWTTLINHLGGSEVAGRKMKATGDAYWNTPNIATNESGFSALPGGTYDELGYFEAPGYHANFWSATSDGGGGAYYRSMYYNISNVNASTNIQQMSYSVRCIKD